MQRIKPHTIQSKYRVRHTNDCFKFAGDEHADNEPSPVISTRHFTAKVGYEISIATAKGIANSLPNSLVKSLAIE